MILLGSKIKELRIKNKMSQAQLADRLGLTRAVISAYERDLRTPSYEVLIKLTQIFKVSSDYMLGIGVKKDIDSTGLTNDEIDAVNHLIKTLKEK